MQPRGRRRDYPPGLHLVQHDPGPVHDPHHETRLAWDLLNVRGHVEDHVLEAHMSIRDVQAEFEQRWVVIFRAYEPLLRAKAPALVSLVSAVKGLALNCYLQGRTDEMTRQAAQERLSRTQLTRISTLLRGRHAPRD